MLHMRFQKQKGFSLIEAIIAIFVLSVGVTAVVQLFASTATQSRENARHLTAMGLAQEGIELVRVVRNDNIVQGKSGTDVFYGLSANGCIDTVGGGLVPCSKDGSRLAVTVDGQRYGYTASASASGYPVLWRKIFVQNNTDSVEVYSVVFFREPSASNFPSDVNDVATKCTLGNSCVFAKAVLQ